MINPVWLKTFTKLAELGNFTRAAEQLGLTQAAVSQHVRQLEKSCGPLLVRHGRQSELTPHGEALIQYAAEMEAADRRLSCRLSDHDNADGEIRLITPGSIGLFLYPRLLDIQTKHPGIAICHRFGPDREVVTEVLLKHYDFGIVSFKPNDSRLAARYFCTEPLELVVPAAAKPEGWKNCWNELVRLGFIDHPDGMGMAKRLLNRRFPDNPGVETLTRRGFSNQIGHILDPVSHGLGFTVIPRYARLAFPRQEDVRLLDCGQQVKDTLWLIHRAEWPLPVRAERILSELAEFPQTQDSPPHK